MPLVGILYRKIILLYYLPIINSKREQISGNLSDTRRTTKAPCKKKHVLIKLNGLLRGHDHDSNKVFEN